MTWVRGLWGAAGSLVVVDVGAFGPWAERFGLGVDGSDDELVGVVALIAAVALLVFAVTGNRVLAAVPLLAGLVAVMVVGHDLTDPAGPFGGPGPNIHLEWGIWVAFAGSIGLALASVLLFVDAVQKRQAASARSGESAHLRGDDLRGRLRSIRKRRRAGQAGAASRAAERATRAAEKREAEWLVSFLRIASRVTPHVSVEREGALFFSPTVQKAGVDRFAKPEWKEIRHLQRALDVLDQVGAERSRATFVDVGAHIGTTAITAVGSFGFESALAFEPDVANFRLLEANLAVNGLGSRIQAFNVAVSNRVGTAELVLRPRFGSKQRLLRDDELAANTEQVRLTTLDTFVQNGSIDPAGSVFFGSISRDMSSRRSRVQASCWRGVSRS